MSDTVERQSGRAEQISHVVVRFAGDSGDGMQLTGDRFTSASALFGNDLSTFPDYPAEIRAPAGTVNGVSSFQVHISDHDITTPGDQPNVLIAMNPAALKAALHRLEQGGLLILNTDAFDQRDLEKAEYHHNPLDTDELNAYRVVRIPMTSLTQKATEALGVKPRDAERSKNFFALGLVSWLYSRPIEATTQWIESRFKDLVKESNLAAFKAGYAFGEIHHGYPTELATEVALWRGQTALNAIDVPMLQTVIAGLEENPPPEGSKQVIAADLLRAFGQYWSSRVGPENYRDILGATGTSVTTVLANMVVRWLLITRLPKAPLALVAPSPTLALKVTLAVPALMVRSCAIAALLTKARSKVTAAF